MDGEWVILINLSTINRRSIYSQWFGVNYDIYIDLHKQHI